MNWFFFSPPLTSFFPWLGPLADGGPILSYLSDRRLPIKLSDAHLSSFLPPPFPAPTEVSPYLSVPSSSPILRRFPDIAPSGGCVRLLGRRYLVQVGLPSLCSSPVDHLIWDSTRLLASLPFRRDLLLRDVCGTSRRFCPQLTRQDQAGMWFVLLPPVLSARRPPSPSLNSRLMKYMVNPSGLFFPPASSCPTRLRFSLLFRRHRTVYFLLSCFFRPPVRKMNTNSFFLPPFSSSPMMSRQVSGLPSFLIECTDEHESYRPAPLPKFAGSFLKVSSQYPPFLLSHSYPMTS